MAQKKKEKKKGVITKENKNPKKEGKAGIKSEKGFGKSY